MCNTGVNCHPSADHQPIGRFCKTSRTTPPGQRPIPKSLQKRAVGEKDQDYSIGWRPSLLRRLESIASRLEAAISFKAIGGHRLYALEPWLPSAAPEARTKTSSFGNDEELAEELPPNWSLRRLLGGTESDRDERV